MNDYTEQMNAWSQEDTAADVMPYHRNNTRLWAALTLVAVAVFAAAWLAVSLSSEPAGTQTEWSATPSASVTLPPETIAPLGGPAVDAALATPAQTLSPPAPTAVVDSSSTDQRYLALLNSDGFVITDAQEVIAMGHRTCENLAVTRNLWHTEQWLNLTMRVYEPNAHEIVIAAATIYCPDL